MTTRASHQWGVRWVGILRNRAVTPALRGWAGTVLIGVLLVSVLFAGSVSAQGGGDSGGDGTAEPEADGARTEASPPAGVGTVALPIGPVVDTPQPAAGLRVVCAYRAGSQRTGNGGTEEGEAGERGEREDPAGQSVDAAEAARAPEDCPGEARASLGDRIFVRVSDLRALLGRAEGPSAAVPPERSTAPPPDCRRIVLFLAGAPLEGIAPTSCNLATDEVAFDLRRTGGDDQDWHQLLGHPLERVRTVRLTLGPANDLPLPSEVDAFELVILSGGEALLFLVLLVACAAALLRLAATTPMLRDSQAEAPPGRRPYSLARCQMAWWFFLAAASYVLIWLVLGELDTLPASVVGLMGISSATAVAATAIDGKKRTDQELADAAAGAAEAGRNQVVALQATNPAAAVEAQVRSARAVAEQERLRGAVKGPTQGFLRDLLSDGSGLSFHRFQVVGWTLLLGAIFLAEVYQTLTMPEFSATLLGLMGVSSGTYLGLKIPERPGRAPGA